MYILITFCSVFIILNLGFRIAEILGIGNQPTPQEDLGIGRCSICSIRLIERRNTIASTARNFSVYNMHI